MSSIDPPSIFTQICGTVFISLWMTFRHQQHNMQEKRKMFRHSGISAFRIRMHISIFRCRHPITWEIFPLMLKCFHLRRQKHAISATCCTLFCFMWEL